MKKQKGKTMAEYDNEISKEFSEYVKNIYNLDKLSEDNLKQLKLSYFTGVAFGVDAIMNNFNNKDPFEALSYLNNIKQELTEFIDKIIKELKNVQNK